MQQAQHRRTGIINDPIYARHRPSAEHPESPLRCDAVWRGICDGADASRLVPLTPRKATIEELRLNHTLDYIESVAEDVAQGVWSLRTGDTEICADSWEVALMAVGGVFEAIDAVFDGRIDNAFCNVRPPGHHATPDRGMGFCVFNNVALGARYARARHGISRVLIADWDVHHGNGTQDAFYDDPAVFYFSTHQWPLYPGTGIVDQCGSGPGKGFTVNCPCPVGSGGHEIIGAFRQYLVPAMRTFQPELVLVSAGFDGCSGDTLGGFVLTEDDFATLTSMLLDVADSHAGGRLVSCLEGGYALHRLAATAGAHVRVLCGG